MRHGSHIDARGKPDSAPGPRRMLLALAALCAGVVPAAAQTYVGNDFAPGSSLYTSLQTIGAADQYQPFVILQEYSPSGPTTSGAIFGSAGTVNDVTFYGGGNYDFTVYALALDSTNMAKNELTFSVVGDQTFFGDATTTGVQNLAASFSVGAGDYLAFSGIGPYYPQAANDAVGSDATYESSSEPQTYPTSFTAIPPTAGQTFTVGAHGDSSATYQIVPNPFENQGRSYGVGVTYTSSAGEVFLNSASLGGTSLSWSNKLGQSNWVNVSGASTSPPAAGQDVFITNRTGAPVSETIMTFDAASDPKINSLTIDSAPGSGYSQFVELYQPTGTLTTGSETIGTTGPAEHFLNGGVNNITSALIVSGSGIYNLEGGTLNTPTVSVNGGYFFFNGGTANVTTFNLYSGTVASGTPATAAFPTNVGNFGSGAEVISGAGTLTPGAPATITGGETFNQTGGNNCTGALTVGSGAGQVGQYNLSGGTLIATAETIGGGNLGASNTIVGNGGDAGVFVQSGSGTSNLVDAAVTVQWGSFYLMQGGSLDPTAIELTSAGSMFGQAGVAGSFTQTGGMVIPLNVNDAGHYVLEGGQFLVAYDMQVVGVGSFFQAAGQATVEGNFTNTGYVTIANAGVTLAVGGTYSNSGTTLLRGATLQAGSFLNTAGSIGGTGTLIGPVTVTGGTVQVGASPDTLHIEGDYSQTGGIITFDVDPDGKGGFLESDLLFDPGNSVSITGTKIVFDFLDGANPLAFFKSGDFNLDAFFKESDGSLFSNDFNLLSLFAGDTFATNMPGFGITGFGADGGVDVVQTSIPEPSTWAMLIVGFAGLGFAGWRRGRARAAIA
jgi:hypothetical protein